ncbi:MAG: ammonium transporter, partial [Verrucomicrobiota bacterium]
GYLVYTVVLSGAIYPVAGHWAWGGAAAGLNGDFGQGSGWLSQMGFRDFAGSTVVHAVGGASALAGILVIGPRKGRFAEDGSPRYLPGHNLPLATFGTLILWVGWFGFNAGSLLSASDELGKICVNTVIAGSAGAVAAMAWFWVIRGVPNPLVAMNGILGGLVAITACCDLVSPVFAILIGAIAGIVSTAGASILEKMRIDDVVGAVPVHLFNGIWGTLCVGLFAEGALFDLEATWIQLIGSLSISVFAFLVALLGFRLVDVTLGLRANEREQEDGLDFSEHSANSYPDFVTTDRN